MKNSKIALALNAIVKFLLGGAMYVALLFLPAGSWGYVGAWRLLSLLFGPMFIMGIYMLIASPALLRRRLSSGEKRSVQRGVQGIMGLATLVGFVIAGLDWRFGWSNVDHTAVMVCSALFLVGYGLYFEVTRENTWASRTIEVAEKQEVIQTGLYGIVRHPMYLATLLMFLPMPIILGSWWALCAFVLYIPILVVRIGDEEKLLQRELKGYADYCLKVKWRLLPFVW